MACIPLCPPPCPPCPTNPGLTVTNGVPTGAPAVGQLPIAFDAAGRRLYGWEPTTGWFPISGVVPT